jgi:ABC-2 type transport system permease protein
VLRLLAVGWWLQLKLRSRSAFDGALSLLWPLFFATAIFLMYGTREQSGGVLLSAAVGAAVMGIWSATSVTAARPCRWSVDRARSSCSSPHRRRSSS